PTRGSVGSWALSPMVSSRGRGRAAKEPSTPTTGSAGRPLLEHGPTLDPSARPAAWNNLGNEQQRLTAFSGHERDAQGAELPAFATRRDPRRSSWPSLQAGGHRFDPGT